MKTSLRFRLTLTYLAVILLGMSLAALLVWLAVEQLYLKTQKANLLAQAQLVATALQNDTLTPASPGPYSQMANVLPGIHTRLIDEQGAVVIDLQSSAPVNLESGLALPALAQGDTQPVSPDELLERPEIAQALSGQPSTAIRRLATLPGNPRILYVAAPVKTGIGQVVQVVYIASPLPDTGLAALPAAIRWQLLGAVALAIALATAMGWGLARHILQPLTHLAQAANAVAAGDLNQAVPEDTAIADLRDLGRSFNTMTASLRQADQLKTAFVADASHELRTPLTAIKGFVETLQDGAIDDLEVRDGFLASVAAETERLIRLVNDLLLLSRADAQTLNLRLQPLDLPLLARTRADCLAPLAAQRQVSLRVIGPADSRATPTPLVLADPDRVAQVLDNLLENAIRHSQPGHAVTITIIPAKDEVGCAVADTGSGIPAQHQPFIFERFYRVEAARSRQWGNSGLGLAIARALVLAQSGQIVVQSQEGQGTTMTFTLPIYRDCP
jgi:two-component system OmpR family sensor kinase/two-component system sensor histidine kinase BaeS